MMEAAVEIAKLPGIEDDQLIVQIIAEMHAGVDSLRRLQQEMRVLSVRRNIELHRQHRLKRLAELRMDLIQEGR